MDLTIRPAVATDAESCGRIIFEAFNGILERHGFPPQFPSVEVAIQRANFCITHPSIFGVVAECDGRPHFGSLNYDYSNGSAFTYQRHGQIRSNTQASKDVSIARKFAFDLCGKIMHVDNQDANVQC